MALHISEFRDMGEASNGASVPVAGAAVTTQTRTISGTAASSAAFAKGTRFVRLCSDVTCFYTIGDVGDTTATTSSERLPADAIEYRSVRPGQVISAITA